MVPPETNIVMVVEDDMDTREALCTVLEMSGYEPIGAENGRVALDLLRDRDPAALPCLIILDIMMPVMDGWEFSTELQRDPSFAAIPIVILTADLGARSRADGAGVAAFIAKPVEVDGLLDTIGRFC